ncbi:hypothetical protein EIP86_007624 [Pleurotus ostreatoroseus]|nr:hypothetical protein EIP86_007624 [Pleurotus ostreatoroseus]
MTSYLRSWLSPLQPLNQSNVTVVRSTVGGSLPGAFMTDDEEDNDDTETIRGDSPEQDDAPPAFPSINSVQRLPSSASTASVPRILTDSERMPPPPPPALASARRPGPSPPSSGSANLLGVPSSGGLLALPPTTTKPPPKVSRKVALAPGHGPLDWANLKKSGTDLRGQAEAFIASAIQEGEPVRAGSSNSEASVNDLLANVHDVDSDEERRTLAQKDAVADEQEHRAPATAHNASMLKTMASDSRGVPLDDTESGQGGSTRSSVGMSSSVASMTRENTERISVPKTELAMSVELPAERIQTSASIPSDSVRTQPESTKGLSNGTASPSRVFQDYARPEARPMSTLTDRNSSSPNNSILEETKRLLIPVITENARLRNPDADIEMIKKKIMSMVTDDQCLEFVRLAKDVNGQMRDRQRQRAARAESELSESRMSVDSSEEGVKISTKRARESPDTETSRASKAFRYEVPGSKDSKPLTPTDVSVTGPPQPQRTPKAPRAMLAREERYKAQDLLHLVESEIKSRQTSHKSSPLGVQHTTASGATQPLPPTPLTDTSSSTHPSPHTSPAVTRTNGDDQSGSLQLQLTSETPVLEIRPVNLPKLESVAMDVVQLPKAESPEAMDIVQETTVAEVFPPTTAKHEKSETVLSLDTAGTTSHPQPAETVTARQIPEFTKDDNCISSTPEPSSPIIVDVPVVQNTHETVDPEGSMVCEVEPQDEPMPLATENPTPVSEMHEQSSNPEADRPPEIAAAPLVPQAQPHDQTLVEERAREQPFLTTDPVSPSVPPEEPVPGLWFAAVGQSRPNVYDIAFNVSEETAAAIKRWSERNITFCPGTPQVYVHLLSLPVSAVTKMNEELEPTATPEDIVAKLQAIPTTWPAPGKLIVQLGTDSTTPAVWYPGREDLKDTPIDLSPHVRPGRNSARVIQLSDASDKFFVLCAGIPSNDEMQRYALAVSR